MRVRDVLNRKLVTATGLMTRFGGEGEQLVSDEYEFAVGGNAARQMLTALGWQEVVTVDKARLESKTEDLLRFALMKLDWGYLLNWRGLTEDSVDVKYSATNAQFSEKPGYRRQIMENSNHDTTLENLQNNV